MIETTFDAADGNVIVVDLGDGIAAKYGHLKEVKVSVGDEIKQGQIIGTLGKSGMATGSNLLSAAKLVLNSCLHFIKELRSNTSGIYERDKTDRKNFSFRVPAARYIKAWESQPIKK